MDIESLLRESRAEELGAPLGLRTEVGLQQFRKQLSKFTSNLGLLQRRQDTILAIRSVLSPELEQKVDAAFEQVREVESELKVFFERTEVETDSYGQLLFSNWKSLQVLNTIPFALFILAFYKQFIVPAMAVMMPLAIVIFPFLILKFMYNLPMSPQQYTQIMMNMLGLQNLDLTNPRTLLQGALTLFSIGQSIYQPIQNAIHLQTIHKDMMKKAESLEKLVQSIHILGEHIPAVVSFNYSLQDIETQDTHRRFAEFWDSPYRLRLALTTIGDCEVLYRFAKASFLDPVTFVKGSIPFLNIVNGTDPFLQTPIPFSLDFTSRPHAILTGPNRGGKSSVLRTTLLTVVFAQTFGFATGQVTIRPFDWIATGLRLEDRPGSTSMFESEVEFSVQIYQRATRNPDEVGFVLFDELFHSTNPPDGARTADIFLQKLWKTQNVASFISTHVFDLAKKSGKPIQKLCVPAHKKEDGSLYFTYTLQKGICEVSSVDEILKEKGLFD